MNKIFIGGMGALSDLYKNHPCGVNVNELLINPSMILWTDKLIIPKKSYENIINKKDKKNRVISIIIDKLSKKDMLEVIDYNAVYNKDVFDEIYKRAENEVKLFSKNKEQKCFNGKIIPQTVDFDGCKFCAPKIASIYSSIKISKESDAICLLNKTEKEYLNRFIYEKKKCFDYNGIFSEIISINTPVFDEIFHYMYVTNKLCSNCKNEKKCDIECIENSNKCFDNILKIREYDTMYQLRELIDSIINEKNQINNEDDVNYIKSKYIEKKEKAEKMLHVYLPKIKKWSNIAVFIGLPLSIVTDVSPAVNIIPGMINVAADYLISKNNWVSIVDDIRNVTD